MVAHTGPLFMISPTLPCRCPTSCRSSRGPKPDLHSPEGGRSPGLASACSAVSSQAVASFLPHGNRRAYLLCRKAAQCCRWQGRSQYGKIHSPDTAGVYFHLHRRRQVVFVVGFWNEPVKLQPYSRRRMRDKSHGGRLVSRPRSRAFRSCTGSLSSPCTANMRVGSEESVSLRSPAGAVPRLRVINYHRHARATGIDLQSQVLERTCEARLLRSKTSSYWRAASA